MSKLIYGIGINDGKYPAKVNGKMVKEYGLWTSMLERCYSKKSHLKCPTYIDCEVSDNFKHYSYFYEWCQDKVGFKEGFTLDKDLLVKGNKIYSENTCVFLPQEINKLLIKRGNKRGNYLIGVSWHKRDCIFESYVGLNNSKRNYLGRYDTELEAFNAYKQAKELFIKEQANKWKHQIDERAYQALMNYQVEITD